jgi:hypothetical protein
VDPNFIYRKDFGFGLYTTSDLERAEKFSINKIKGNPDFIGEQPCVLEFEVLKDQYHPFLITGPIADNQFSEVLAGLDRFVASKVQNGEEPYEFRESAIQWFLEQIKMGSNGHPIPFKDLNIQIVFCTDEFQILMLRKYYTFSKSEGWVSHNEY